MALFFLPHASRTASVVRWHPLAWLLGLLLLAALLGGSTAGAADSPPAPERGKQEAEAAWEAARAAGEPGPRTIFLAGQAELRLPAGLVYIPPEPAKRLQRAQGIENVDNTQGMIVPEGDGAQWVAFLRYEPAGFVKDEDATRWNPAHLLESYREGVKVQNKRRQSLGLPELEVVGWIAEPYYDARTHQVFWSIEARDKGADGADATVNYQTLSLGRQGYVSMVLVDDRSHVDALKPAAQELLKGLTFSQGKRYADFRTGDKVAAVGLAALITGVAVKKLGLLALLAAFFVKFAKLILIGVAGAGLILRRIFRMGGKKNSEPPYP
ncbi:MAG: DUF2167 domain-containing protein [Candidatus Methylacidiphilaceae bacterium]